jgi:hypothetical protein
MPPFDCAKSGMHLFFFFFALRVLRVCNSIGVLESDYEAEVVKGRMPLLHKAQKRHAAWHKLSLFTLISSYCTEKS